MSLFEPIFEALARDQARFVVVGGVAVVLHGFARLTADLDLALELEPAEARRALDALTRIGLRPRLPVEAHEFADPAIRSRWSREKGLRVFSLLDPANPMLLVDLFAENPIPFDDLWTRSELVRLDTTDVRVASIADLIEPKRRAGSPQERIDIEALEAIQERKRSGRG